MAGNPIERFNRWLAEARRAGAPLPERMALATTSADGQPSCRHVLLKHADAQGFVFYTNFESRKGRELAANPRASLAFYWDATGKQVCVVGRVREVSAAEADAYWAERPGPSQIASAASAQSRPLSSRAELLARFREIEKRYEGAAVPRPRHWSGFRLHPTTIEFWTRAEPRLHKRELYRRTRDGWTRTLLQP